MSLRRWQLVLPVKGGGGAKSRLAPPGPHRTALAEAVWRDCLDAVLACPVVRAVLLVTSDPVTATHATAAGAVAVAETHPGAGLVAAVTDGLAAADDGPVAVLLPDLPALRPDDLADALAAVDAALDRGGTSAFVPDAEGTGTVLLAGTRPQALRPAFGTASALAHESAGALRLEPALPRLRRDVDTQTGLLQALRMGVGPRTAALTRA